MFTRVPGFFDRFLLDARYGAPREATRQTALAMARVDNMLAEKSLIKGTSIQIAVLCESNIKTHIVGRLISVDTGYITVEADNEGLIQIEVEKVIGIEAH